ncbi:MAG: endonuclease/exonuclease/phosphatase family protein [Rhodocyclaceae bacterium]|nr:endonuclease/exonuclease/phosphatase family protein [Rhodocyclaceae bacterium]
MPTLADLPPPEVQSDLEALRAHLHVTLPAKRLDENLLIATWNLRGFASLTREWTAGERDSPKRDLRGLLAIGEIVRRFDVIAIQEVKGDLRALRDLLKWLGPDWAFLMTDVSGGAAGNDERMAFLFDRRRVELSGLACELVVPPEWLTEIAPGAMKSQFARTPYAVSFRSGKATFIMVTLHVLWGEDSAERIPELSGIARWLAEWAQRSSNWEHNLIALGDFNIDRKGDPLWRAFTSTGLKTPADLDAVPRSIFCSAEGVGSGKFYDQIAWFEDEHGMPMLGMSHLRAGHVDFLPYVYRGVGLTKSAISYRVSDHYPLWAEFAV